MIVTEKKNPYNISLGLSLLSVKSRTARRNSDEQDIGLVFFITPTVYLSICRLNPHPFKPEDPSHFHSQYKVKLVCTHFSVAPLES